MAPAVALAVLTGLGGAAPSVGRASAQEANPTVAAMPMETTPAEVPPGAVGNWMMPATISVAGTGTVNVPPDTASVTLGIDVIRPDLADAQTEASRQATAIIEAVQAQGVAIEDIQTSNFSVNVMRDYSSDGDPTQVTGFEVMNQVNVTIRDISNVGPTLDAVIAAGANSIWGVNFFIDDPRPFEAQARTAAVDDATETARQLAEAAGGTLGRVIAVSEDVGGAAPMPVFGRGGGMAAAEMATPIEAGSSQVSVTVQMTFALDQ
ncbi:MAG: SIMPL domain-containing protein [Thermomicrobiales bacterium]|nr:SIMPL domain-containing protein [Thermomicrobiales bacterium]